VLLVTELQYNCSSWFTSWYKWTANAQRADR